MALNILKDDPDYLIENMLLPAKERFFKEVDWENKKTKWRFSTFSFGTISLKESPEIVDECIRDIEKAKKMHGQNKIKWDDVLEMGSADRAKELTNKLIDMKQMRKSTNSVQLKKAL